MNCEEVSKQLTEYLDKNLDTAMTTRVATHVISCALCRAESNELADCIQQVATLPAIDPPIGFAQRVMAHIHDGEPQASLWQRLILPLTSRVPVQATAMAVIAVFVIALYQTEQPLKPSNDVNLALRYDAQAPIKEKESARAFAAPTTATPETRNSVSAQAKTPTEASKLAVAETSLRAASVSPAQSQQLQPAAAAPLRAEIESALEEKTEAPRRPPLRVQEVTTGRESSRPMLGDALGFSAPLAGTMQQAAPRLAPMALERAIPIGDRVADFEFVVRRRSPQRRDIVEKLSSPESLQKSLEADNPPSAASRPAAPPSTGRAKIESIAEIRFYNVAPEHFEFFKKELAIEANIESEPKASAKEIDAAKQADRQLLIKVTILPTDNAAPSR